MRPNTGHYFLHSYNSGGDNTAAPIWLASLLFTFCLAFVVVAMVALAHLSGNLPDFRPSSWHIVVAFLATWALISLICHLLAGRGNPRPL